MGDIDDADAARAQTPQRAEQALDVRLGQRGRRLVENENVRLDRERAADGDERALGGGKRGDRRVRVEVAAHDRERFCGRLAAPSASERARRRERG